MKQMFVLRFPGDPQTAVSHLGDVVLFVQYALAKFKVSEHDRAPPIFFAYPTLYVLFDQFNSIATQLKTSSNIDHHLF
jgi:hypothetical protein